MKSKGISFFEQNVEKIVLGAAGVAFVSVLVWQLGFPTKVTVEGKSVSLSELDEMLNAKNALLSQKLDQAKQSSTPLREQIGDRLASTAGGFRDRKARAVADGSDLPLIEPAIASLLLDTKGAIGGERYHVPSFAALQMRPAVQIDDTVLESFVSANEDAKKLFAGDTAPYDVSWALASAVVDLQAMRDELRSTSGGVQIPEIWFNRILYVVDVEFERETLQPDGTWGAPTLVAPLPGATSFRADVTKNPDAGLRDSVWEYLGDERAQKQIVQPDFLPTQGGNFGDWIAAGSEDAAKEAEDPELRRLRKLLERKERDVAQLEAELKKAGGPLEEAPKDGKKDDDDESGRPPRGGSGGGGGASRPGGGLGGGGLSGGMEGGKNTGGSAATDEASKEKRIRMTRTLKLQRERLEKLREDFSKRNASAQESQKPKEQPKFAEQDSIVTWVHDLGVETGKTYRYRAVVRTYNPFFTNGGVLVEEQKPLGDPFTLGTKVSDWSPAITITPPLAFFVTDAVANEGRLGVGQASVEVFRYQGGRRHSERFTVQPGDAIGGRSDAGIDFETGFYLVDVIPDPAGERGGSDRRLPAVAIVQSASGKIYEIRVPRVDLSSPSRLNYEDEIAMADEKAKADSESKSGSAAEGPSGGGRG